MNEPSHTLRLLTLVVGAPLLAASWMASRQTDVALASLDLSKMRVQPAGGRGGACCL